MRFVLFTITPQRMALRLHFPWQSGSDIQLFLVFIGLEQIAHKIKGSTLLVSLVSRWTKKGTPNQGETEEKIIGGSTAVTHSIVVTYQTSSIGGI